MKETLKVKVVPFEIAKLLKEMGFDEKINENYTYTYPWVKKGGIKVAGGYKEHYWSCTAYSNTEWETNMSAFAKALRFDGKHPPISAPSYDMVIDWILEKYDYFVKIVMVGKDEFRFEIVTYCVEIGLCNSDEKSYPDRYSAMDAAFKRILNMVKDRKESTLIKQLMEKIRKEKEDGQAKND